MMGGWGRERAEERGEVSFFDFSHSQEPIEKVDSGVAISTGVGEVSGHSALKKWQKKVASGLLHHQAKVWSRHLGTMLREERQGLPEA